MAFLTIMGGTRVRARAFAATFSLEIGALVRVKDARQCPRVLYLMYPSGTRAALSVRQTDN